MLHLVRPPAKVTQASTERNVAQPGLLVIHPIIKIMHHRVQSHMSCLSKLSFITLNKIPALRHYEFYCVECCAIETRALNPGVAALYWHHHYHTVTVKDATELQSEWHQITCISSDVQAWWEEEGKVALWHWCLMQMSICDFLKGLSITVHARVGVSHSPSSLQGWNKIINISWIVVSNCFTKIKTELLKWVSLIDLVA